MPIITFANTKGGAGKTTAVLLLATELVRRGYRVSVIDTDPQRWISRWFEGAQAQADGPAANLKVATYISVSALARTIEAYRGNSDYIIVDLPGAQSPLLATALGLSDHVMIPIQGSAMDAQGGAQVIELLQYLDAKGNIRIPHSVVLSRVNSLVTTRALRAVKILLAERSVRVLATPIIERAAYRDMFEHRVSLHHLDPERVSNLDKAIVNAERYCDEVETLVPAVRMPVADNRSTGFAELPMLRAAY
ncbi:ParA family protein [Allorhizobium taibaishanense]|uniref:Chromosome partitioning protein n=1 Tax=Allorhizobium taibaishanense TaxID=887144 RepID=A0A1Q9A2D9_9HYPH|nr:ParA family protein [Allorhizobium taibaishanense]MBB4009062.1 chromosome partitioning protein [Allorhizobium taibaishanense]OLP48634.1 chromosome partitioning protein ParA [Allorhizobium taibaishanense]